MGYFYICTDIHIYMYIHMYWIHLHIVHGVSFLTILNEKWMSGPARTRASRQDLDKETSKCRQLEEVETWPTCGIYTRRYMYIHIWVHIYTHIQLVFDVFGEFQALAHWQLLVLKAIADCIGQHRSGALQQTREARSTHEGRERHDLNVESIHGIH